MAASGAINAFDARLAENSSASPMAAPDDVNSSVGIDGCDLFDGRWVEDGSGPLYAPGSCPIIDDSFDCFKNGRPDSEFVRLRWRPRGCAIPRCAASEFTLIVFLFSVSVCLSLMGLQLFDRVLPITVPRARMVDKGGQGDAPLQRDRPSLLRQNRDAYFIVFNTGHWWTHEEMSLGLFPFTL
ncbi:hypothetical protein QJS10_CPA10g01365 [Acorus calamus]|uniref:Trichome birefringence-like N-terminal domain-containing protein n=1 Tax=Acorus calamus TaxID=4465 RepID=A0AAV9DV27_ACOCL|nr:hypothetical protein QJS10_CPA10g01365 [Acorus calamus]